MVSGEQGGLRERTVIELVRRRPAIFGAWTAAFGAAAVRQLWRGGSRAHEGIVPPGHAGGAVAQGTLAPEIVCGESSNERGTRQWVT